MGEEKKEMDKVSIQTKGVLTTSEAAAYMGVSKSYVYKLTMKRQIPHSKPMGKMCYFNRLELEQWLQQNRVETVQETDQKAQAYCRRKRKGGLK
jgi:excisionase family DNA binding protein